jgi:hypothetical protein
MQNKGYWPPSLQSKNAHLVNIRQLVNGYIFMNILLHHKNTEMVDLLISNRSGIEPIQNLGSLNPEKFSNIYAFRTHIWSYEHN